MLSKELSAPLGGKPIAFSGICASTKAVAIAASPISLVSG